MAGRSAGLIPAQAAENTVWLAAVGEHGLLFVNGEFVSSLDLSGVAGAGDVAAMTGAFTGDEVAGAVTQFEDFQVFPLHKRYGPASGKLGKRARICS